jgi:ABC-type nickel/cobalt efflux system permease component RcnA
MTDLKSLLAASALALVMGAAAPAIAGEHKAEDGKKVEKHDHKDGDHKDHGKHEGHKDGDHHDHKEGDGHDHDKEKAGKPDTKGKGQ